MSEDVIIQILVIAVLILLSAFFSATEIAFSSLNQIKLKHMIQNGNKRANHTLKLAVDFDRILTTILVGNNIVNILSASLATIIFVKYWGDYGVTLSTAVMTILVLIFGEIAPKSIAKKLPEKFAMTITPILQLFIWILFPLSFIFGGIQKLINKGIKEDEGPTITEEELLTYVSEVQQEGGINENEGDLIRNVIDFDDLKVEEIFTPRVNVVAVAKDEDIKKMTQTFRHSGYSRLPVYEESIDHVIGIINHKDFYNRVVLDHQPLEDIIKPPVFVTEYMKVSNLLELLQEHKSHMAIVKDEFGGTLGVVTMEDILEEIVGEIWDEHDEIVEQITQIDEYTYKVKGTAEIDHLFELLDIEDEMEPITVNGWVQDELGKIPMIGESFIFKNLKVVVSSADTKKVLEVNIHVVNLEPELNEDVE
ncbi:MAG: hemolysin family protein [Acholeplasmataceae bacterium]|jgi:CBS domain containing-hemolysin-like protein|nr:hemolysin family protein [Acholeplasmataceae bacterium]